MPAQRGAPPPSSMQRSGAEFLGVMLLVSVAAGADVMARQLHPIGHAAHYVAPALLMVAMIWSLSGVSGAHLNPAVTLAFVQRGSFPGLRGIGYVVAQLAGGVAGAAIVRGVFGGDAGFGVNAPGAGFASWQAVCVEALSTFILVFVVLATTEEKAVVGKNAAIAVGCTIALSGLSFGSISGASLNPARSFGPALVMVRWENYWIYIVGPVAGAIAATLTVRAIYGAASLDERANARGKDA